ncbi:MAG: transcriptional regulator [Geobacteraceae bacterium]|nr:transcriptional regulator [Geobacteraceae bacterium]
MRLLIWLILIYVGFKIVQGFLRQRVEGEQSLPPRGEETHRDPVCGVYVTEADAVVGRVEDKRLYFCSMACLEKYREQLENKS